MNAIDANIIPDEKTGEMYMVYGLFWGGCHALRLDKTTGLAAEEGIGTLPARHPEWMDGAMEESYVVCHPETNYYYLFVSYGSLKSDYQIGLGAAERSWGCIPTCTDVC